MSSKKTSPYDSMPWLASYDKGVPHEFNFEPANICTLLDAAARENPDTVAVIFRDYKLTYSQLLAKAETIAANLALNGVRPGDRVALMMPNMPQIAPSFWGILKAGAIVVMVNPLYMENELLHLVTDSGARHLITISACWPKLNALRFRLGVEKFFISEITDILPFHQKILFKLLGKRDPATMPTVVYDDLQVFPYAKLTQKGARLSVPYGDPETQIALLQYTGGTTGVPKGVMLTHRNQSSDAAQTLSTLLFLKGTHQVFACLLPIFHIYGLMTCLLFPTALRATCIMIPRYDPGDLLSLIEKYKVTIFPGAPSVYLSLLQHKDFGKYDLTSLRLGISGSAPIPPVAMEKFGKISGCRFIEGYGLTEASPITHLTPGLGKQKFGSIGVPLPGTTARIVDMDVGTIEMPVNEVGELIIKGPQVMSGYYNRPDDTAGAIRNGWLYTGDIAYMDEDGYFYIVDRKKDMAIVGGFNVFPREIDEVLLEHPDVKEAVSVAIAHPTRGEIIKAFIVPKEGTDPAAIDIIKFCRQRLAGYKVPRQVEFRKELPRAATGKILRRTLQAEEIAKIAADPLKTETEIPSDSFGKE